MSERFWLALVVAVLAGCGEDAKRIDGSARFVNGPTAGSASASTATIAVGGAAAADGFWLVTPDELTFHLQTIRFNPPNLSNPSDSDFADCSVTFSRTAPSLSQRLECPFSIEPGTYASVALYYSTEYDVLISDPANGIFTDPAAPGLLSPVEPAGGAQPVTVIGQGPPDGSPYASAQLLATPLVVSDGDPDVAIDVVVHGLHSVKLDVAGGVPSFRAPIERMGELYPTLTGASSLEYYTSAASVESTLNFGIVSVFVFYRTADAPDYLFANRPANCFSGGGPNAWAADPDSFPASGGGTRVGGWLGLDDSGTICWAVPGDDAYSTYQGLVRLVRGTNEGETSTLSCTATASPPPPTSGTTYASGCPTLTPGVSVDLILGAN